MLLELFNELKNNFMAVSQIRMYRVNDNVKSFEAEHYIFLTREKSSMIPSGC